jgi:4-hydroxymandelate oxidase
MSEKSNDLASISQIYAKGIENLKERGVDWVYPAGRKLGPSVKANRRYLDSLFFEPKFFDPIEVNTDFRIFDTELRTPVFCSPISRLPYMSENDIVNIAKGIAGAGSLMMLGIGSTSDMQSAIDAGAPVVKIVKPYRKTELIYEKIRDAENHGCVAVGMDIDHFYGLLMEDSVLRAEQFAPQHTDELQQIISETKLPFIVKGVLGVSDAEKALRLGASAIIVSNHGSGSFDFSIPSMIALPKIVARVGDKIDVFVDTGFETGNDVFKAIACGAKAVGFASPFILAVAADGSKAVKLLVNQITAELQRTMAAAGCPDLSSISNSAIQHISNIIE